MQNRFGNFVLPKLAGVAAAAALDTHPNKAGALSIVDPPASKKYRNAYPISTYTYVIVPLKTAKAQVLKQLISWAIAKGQSYGPKLFFEPIAKSVVTFDKNALNKIHS